MRRRLAVFGSTVFLVGCFDPDQTGATDTEGASTTVGGSESAAPPTGDGPTPSATSPTSTAPTGLDTTDTDPDPTGDPSDAPPTVELTVDGSDAPSERNAASRVPLVAQASDDGTVTRVDFFDGDALVGTDDSSPFEARVLLTSLDGGAHSFTALAVDDAGQQTTSAPVDLIVSIDGGSTINDETNLFVAGGIVFHPGVGVIHDEDDNVIVVGSLSTAGFDVFGLGAISLSPELRATRWQRSVPQSLVEGELQYLTMGQPALSANGGAVLMGANSMGVEGNIQPNVTAMRLAVDDGEPLPFLEFDADPEGDAVPLAGLDNDPDGDIILAGPDSDITKVTGTGDVIWRSPVGFAWTTSSFGGHRIRTDLEGDIVLDSYGCGEEGTCALDTRKINGFDGSVRWDASIPISDNELFIHVGGSTPADDGGVLTLHGPPLADGGGLHMVLRDEDGEPQQDLVLTGAGDTFAVADLAYDEQGLVVAVGTRNIAGDTSDRECFAIRFDPTGAVLWQRSLSFGMIDDQAMGLSLDRHGRVAVVGVADLQSSFIVFQGDVWVALLDL